MSRATVKFQSVNRYVAVLKPKKPFLEWINSLPDMDKTPLSFEDLNKECPCYLIPEYDDNEKSREFIIKHFERIFEVELAAWDHSGKHWPENLDRLLFNKFFNIEIHSDVVDLMKGPIEREEY